jgi:hypothetical protein
LLFQNARPSYAAEAASPCQTLLVAYSLMMNGCWSRRRENPGLPNGSQACSPACAGQYTRRTPLGRYRGVPRGRGVFRAQRQVCRRRRAWGWPVVGIDPGRRRSPLAYAAGIRPRDVITCRGFSLRVRSPRAATMVTAPGHCPPRRPSRASTTAGRLQAWTCSRRACSKR